MNTGTIKFFKADKGFGFIKDEHSDEEIFVHVSGLADQSKKNLAPGTRVSYDVEQGRKGPNATNVTVI